MKKLTLLALAGALVISSAAFAQTENDQKIKADVDAINQDNADIQRHNADLKVHGDAEATDKANKNYGDQAVDSAKMVGDKAAIETNKATKAAHQKMLKHHKSKAKKDATGEDSSTSSSQ